MDLEQEILRELNEELNKSVDEGIMYYLMMKYWEEQGWTPVKLSRLQDNRHAVDITMWLADNGFKDSVNYYRDGRDFVFERAEDATAFILRWAGETS